jgi:uncharacterized protein (TIGR03435 family)
MAAVVVVLPGKIGGQEAQAPKMMPADAHPKFEVESIKLADPDEKRDGFDVRGRHVLMENVPVMTMVIFAYGTTPKQTARMPEWAKSVHWDADGVADVEGAPSLAQTQEMIQQLLVERFGLKVHREKREVSGYALTVGKGGPKIAKSQGDPNGMPRQNSHMNAGQRDIKFTNNTMNEFAQAMQFYISEPVTDHTALSGRWDFELKWTADETRAPQENAAPGVFTAVQEQLGLKLEPVKAPMDVLVVDSVQKPGAN